MRLATPRSTPRDDPNHHYLWVIVGMLYVSQGSAGELRGGVGGERWRKGSAGSTGGAGGGRPRMGGGAVAARAYIARTNPNGNSSLGGASPIMHTPVLTGRPLLSISPRFSFPSALSRFYPISFVTFVSLYSPSLSPNGFHRFLHSIQGSTQLQRNRRAILGDKVTS